MPNIALILAYNGGAYHGWQSQINAVSVQDTVEKAIFKRTGQRVRLHGCGRTDAGVHAAAYVASYEDCGQVPADRLPFVINSALPPDIRVYNAFCASDDFHARFSCVKKQYTYTIFDGKIANPFYDPFSMFYPRGADHDAMARAAEYFVGEHDFNAFRSLGTEVKSTVRTVYRCLVERSGDFIKIKITADGFLYNMARTMAGSLIAVSEGRLKPEDIGELLVSGRRERAGDTCPARGLMLTSLTYPDFTVSRGGVI